MLRKHEDSQVTKKRLRDKQKSQSGWYFQKITVEHLQAVGKLFYFSPKDVIPSTTVTRQGHFI